MLRKKVSNKRSRKSNKKKSYVRKLSRKNSKRKSTRRTRTKSRRKSLTKTRRNRRSTMKMIKKETGRRFIHFGCWNKAGCNMEEKEENQTNLTKVMIKLNEVVDSSDDINFLIIAGDNYYPDKEAKEKKDDEKKDKKDDEKKEKKDKENKEKKKPKKKIDLSKFRSGFDCLPKDIKKYVLVGNHELENINDCQLLSLQQEYRNEKNIIFQEEDKPLLNPDGTVSSSIPEDIIMHTTLGDEESVGLTVIIMLDTTMYDNDYNENNDEKTEELLVCYRKLYNTPEATIKDLQEKQQKRVSNLIKMLIDKNIKNVIVVGHHPIISGKTKFKEDGKFKTAFNCMNLLVDLYYNTVYLPLKEQKINFYYFCADLHLYQTGVITYKDLMINQYIAGTGGAELDLYNSEDDTPKKCTNVSLDPPIQYKIDKSEQTCGFMDCYIQNDGTLGIVFHDALKKL